MAINPAIDNKRVILLPRSQMLTSTPANTSFRPQRRGRCGVVAANLDEMAMQPPEDTATEAWSTIFRIASARHGRREMAMKNTDGGTTPTVQMAIYKKLCDVLINLGSAATSSFTTLATTRRPIHTTSV